jgi:hypothetical protein
MSGLDDMDSVRAVHTYSSADGSWTDKAGADGAHLLCLPRASAQLEPTAALLSPVYWCRPLQDATAVQHMQILQGGGACPWRHNGRSLSTRRHVPSLPRHDIFIILFIDF